MKTSDILRLKGLINSFESNPKKTYKVHKFALKQILQEELEKNNSMWSYAFILFLDQTYNGNASKYNGAEIRTSRIIKKLKLLLRYESIVIVFNTLQQASQEKFEERFKGSRAIYKQMEEKAMFSRSPIIDYDGKTKRGKEWL